MAVSKERITDLIDRLSKKDFELVIDLIERLTSTNQNNEIPLDDEPATQEDLDAIKDASEAYLKGELISLKDVEHELRN